MGVGGYGRYGGSVTTTFYKFSRTEHSDNLMQCQTKYIKKFIYIFKYNEGIGKEIKE